MSDPNTSLFGQNAVKVLTEDDFELDSDAPIKLRFKSCMIILFHNDNIESKNLLQIWNAAGKQVVGPIFGSINLNNNKLLAQAFTKLNMENSSLHWAALKTMPFILVYQNRWPIGFYNGERTVQDIIDYSLVLACKAEYHEPVNLYGGMVASNNLMMQGVTQYGIQSNPFKKTSLDFTGKEDIRGYNQNDVPVLAGTQAESIEKQQVVQKELATGTSVNIPTSASGVDFSGVRVGSSTVPTSASTSAPREDFSDGKVGSSTTPILALTSPPPVEDFAGVRVGSSSVSRPTTRPPAPVAPPSLPTGGTRTFVPSRRAPPPPK